MTKRKLNEDEIKLCNNSISRIHKDNRRLNYAVKYHELMLAEGLQLAFEDQFEETKQKLKDVNSQLKTNEQQVNILLDQIKNGVEKLEKEAVEKPKYV